MPLPRLLRARSARPSPSPHESKPPRLSRRRVITLGVGGALLLACKHDASGSAADETIGPLLAPADLVARLPEVKAGKLHVFHVGPEVLFTKGHVPGSRHVGEASEPDGYASMAAAVAALPADAEVVLYCGCCPYRPCPNVRPASRLLRERKMTKGKVLDLPTNLRTDWIEKGYPIEKG